MFSKVPNCICQFDILQWAYIFYSAFSIRNFDSWLLSPPTVCLPNVSTLLQGPPSCFATDFVEVWWWWTNSLSTIFSINEAPEMVDKLCGQTVWSVGFNYWKNVPRGNQTRGHQYAERPCWPLGHGWSVGEGYLLLPVFGRPMAYAPTV